MSGWRRSFKYLIVLGLASAMVPSGILLVGHVGQVDPNTVPLGFLAAHNTIADFPVDALARAAGANGADVFVQHVKLNPNAATGWHTHPGPAIVTIVDGSLTYEYAARQTCLQRVYQSGFGFVDPGFGHVHRAIAGATGAHFYVTYVLPPGSQTHVIAAPAPEECV